MFLVKYEQTTIYVTIVFLWPESESIIDFFFRNKNMSLFSQFLSCIHSLPAIDIFYLAGVTWPVSSASQG